jgi:hypothetical protein
VHARGRNARYSRAVGHGTLGDMSRDVPFVPFVVLISGGVDGAIPVIAAAALARGGEGHGPGYRGLGRPLRAPGGVLASIRKNAAGHCGAHAATTTEPRLIWMEVMPNSLKSKPSRPTGRVAENTSKA